MEASTIYETLSKHSERIALMEERQNFLDLSLKSSISQIHSQNSLIIDDLNLLKKSKIEEDEKWRIIGKMSKSPVVFGVLFLAIFCVALIFDRPDLIDSVSAHLHSFLSPV